MKQKERAGTGDAGPLDRKDHDGFSSSTPENASSTASRKHRPYRRLSDEQLSAAIQALRDEQRHRRDDRQLYQSEVESHRSKEWRYGRTYQLDVMRLRNRSWP